MARACSITGIIFISRSLFGSIQQVYPTVNAIDGSNPGGNVGTEIHQQKSLLHTSELTTSKPTETAQIINQPFKPASDDYYFALEVLLTGKLTAIEGADGKWWVGTDNPGITLTNYDIVKVKPKDKIIPTIAINASYSFSNDGQNNGHFGGGIIWHPWGYGLGIGGGWQQGPVAGLDWVIKQ